MFALWPADQLNFSIFIKQTFGFVGQSAASEAGHIANTNVGRNFAKQFTFTDNEKNINNYTEPCDKWTCGSK